MGKVCQVIGSAIIIIFVLIRVASGDEGYKEITTLELKKWMDTDNRPVLVNSLSPVEFGESYIPGSICIPMELMQDSQSMPADLDTPMVYYCYGPDCMKSKDAVGIAIEMGYKNIYLYQEGLEGWKAAGYGIQNNLELPKGPLPPKEPAELFKELQNEAEIILVDVRDDATRKKFGRISGVTIHLPMYRLHNFFHKLPKDKLLVIYDSKSRQAPTACRYLFQRHFDNVTWLKGGMEAWSKEKFPVE